MEDDMGVRQLAELIFNENFENIGDIMTFDSSFTTCLRTKNFLLELYSVLRFQESIFHPEWDNHINKCCSIMFSSHTIYLQCAIFPCLIESTYNENEFEKFISVCALLKFFNARIFYSTGINFRDLNTDIFMVVYDNVMKSEFWEKGVFKQFVEYIHGHRYLSWEWINLLRNDIAAREKLLKDIKEEQLKRRIEFPHKTVGELKTMKETSGILARQVLSTTSVQLPTLTNDPELIKALKKSMNEEKGEKKEMGRIIQAATKYLDATRAECSSLNSDSTKDVKASSNEEKAEKDESGKE